MKNASRFMSIAIFTLLLTVPALVFAQAVPRGSGSSGSSGSSGGSSSGGSSGGSSGSDSSPSPTWNPPEHVRMPPPPRPAPDGPRTGSAVPRGSGSSGTASTGGRTSNVGGGDSALRAGPDASSADPRSRDRNGRPVSGIATPRQGELPSTYAAWSRWYPVYDWSYPSYYYGYPAYGLSYYDPFYGSRWWSRYGIWYDPYDPIGYDPWMYGGGYGYGGYSGGYSSSWDTPEPREATGAIRVRVKPSNAQLYLDGTLMGVVDQFDGLTTHLAAPAGRHEIEIRADGYEPLKLFVNVEEDRTVTARGSMKKK